RDLPVSAAKKEVSQTAAKLARRVRGQLRKTARQVNQAAWLRSPTRHQRVPPTDRPESAKGRAACLLGARVVALLGPQIATTTYADDTRHNPRGLRQDRNPELHAPRSRSDHAEFLRVLP